MKKPTWKIEWNEGMSVGIPEIDADHKQFMFLINELNRSITEGMQPAEIKGRLQLIVDDAGRHFKQEEELFMEWRYPGAADHAHIHTQALKALQDIQDKFIPYGSDSEWVDAGLMIKSILLSHILTEDMKYAGFHRDSHTKDDTKED